MTGTYEPGDWFTFRMPLLPFSAFTSALTDLGLPMTGSEPADGSESVRAMATWCAHPLIGPALWAASPALMEAASSLTSDDPAGAKKKKVRRVRSGLLRYIIRMSTRSIPFGLFAGVGVGRFGHEAQFIFGDEIVGGIRLKPDTAWLASMLETARQDHRIRADEVLRSHPAMLVAGDRALITCAGLYRNRGRMQVATKNTRLLAEIVRLAAHGIECGKLVRALLMAGLVSSESAAEKVVAQLLEQSVLLGDLEPSLLLAEPAGALAPRLAGLGDCPLPGKVTAVVRELDSRNASPVPAALDGLDDLISRMRGLGGTTPALQPLHVEAALSVRAAELPGPVASAAAAAALAVVAAAPEDYHRPHIREYREKFAARYGSRCEVPVLELLSAELGLGAPRGYSHPPANVAGPPSAYADHQARDNALLAELIKVLRAGSCELSLTSDLVARLSGAGRENVLNGPPSLDVFFQIAAKSAADITGAAWRGVLTRAPSVWSGRPMARFDGLLGDWARIEPDGFTTANQHADVIFAQLSYLPSNERVANVMRVPLRQRFEIPVNVSPAVPDEQVILLQDLVAGLENGRFYVRSRRLKRRVVVVQGHMVRVTTMPNICRFLIELSLDQWHGVGGFSWGPAEGAPYLPRVVHRNFTLRAAEWNIDSATRDELKRPGAAFATAIKQWRERLRVPRLAYLENPGDGLLLDLEHPASLHELERAILHSPGGAVTIRECVPRPDELWLRNAAGEAFAAEFVVPVRWTEAARPAGSDTSARRPGPGDRRPDLVGRPSDLGDRRPVLLTERRKWPGSDWIYLKFYVPQYHHDRFITTTLRDIAAELRGAGKVDRWFYIRYADPEFHIRARFHVSRPGTELAVLGELIAIAEALVASRAVNDAELAPYDRELERYGGAGGIASFERLFHADSELACQLLLDRMLTEPASTRLVTVTRTIDRIAAAWGLDAKRRLGASVAKSDPIDGGADFRAGADQLVSLFGGRARGTPTALEMSGRLERLLDPHSATVSAVRSVIDGDVRFQREFCDSDDMLLSVLHMHMNRMGLDRRQERTVYGLWRRTLQAVEHRRRASGEVM